MPQNIPKTELLFQKSKPIDQLTISEGISLMVKEQKDAAKEVKKASKSIEYAIEGIHRYLEINPCGRLVYVGAGTSARIGVQDGVELFPTFRWPMNRLEFIIAGGERALVSAIENAEDDILEATEIHIKLYPHDSPKTLKKEKSIYHAVSNSAVNLAETVNAKAIVAFTASGKTALRISRERPDLLLIVMTPDNNVRRMLSLVWGARSFVSKVQGYEAAINEARQTIISKTAQTIDRFGIHQITVFLEEGFVLLK